MAAVISVERVQIVLAADTTTVTSPALSIITNTANCVPFMTAGVSSGSDSDDWSKYAVDIDFPDATHVRATTTTAVTREMTVEIGLVQFNPAEVDVQQGAYSIAATATSGTASPTDLGADFATDTFLVHTWLVADTLGESKDSSVRGKITNATTLTFDRVGTVGAINGNWYTATAIGSAWTVQARDWTLSNGNTNDTATALTAVTMAKTFVVGSYTADTATLDNNNYIPYMNLESATVLGMTRQGATGDVVATAYAIELADTGAKVARGIQIDDFDTAPPTGSADDTISPAVTTLANAMAWLPASTSVRNCSMSGTGSPAVVASLVGATLIDVNTIRLFHDPAEPDATEFGHTAWEVIEWELDAGGPAPRRVMVR